MDEFIRIAVSLLPVFTFVIVLLFLDNYKLVKFQSVVTVLIGAGVAFACLIINSWFLTKLMVDRVVFTRYLAPVFEEVLKGIYLVYLVKSKRIGFIVDGAIFGFAIGAGFAFVENVYYLYSLPDASLPTWIIRGFGTAIMHGGTTAIIGIISKNFCDRHDSERIHFFLPGLGIAVLIHSLFNHMILPTSLSTIVILITLPVFIIFSFNRSERSLKKWLNVGFDSDMQILEMIRSGKVLKSKIGKYLYALKSRIAGEVLADIICYLRIFVELSIKAKGILIMHEAGFKVPPDAETKEKFAELKKIKKSIGKIGKLIVLPFLHTSSRDLWQIHMLEDSISSNTRHKPAKKNEDSHCS